MANDYYIDEDETYSEQEEAEMLAEYHYAKSQGFTDWIYKNQSIGNGKQLVEALENTNLQDRYLKEVGLPLDTELEY